jgi:hypothetical protein
MMGLSGSASGFGMRWTLSHSRLFDRWWIVPPGLVFIA